MINSMTPAGELLRSEIERDGPISFERFMQVALYHPQHGYYRRTRDPFGRHGDFFTAAQLQPVFGQLIRAVLEAHTDRRVLVDVGAGRGEMAAGFPEPWRYQAVDYGEPLPSAIEGVLFANELFDALPCRAYGANGEEARVTWAAGEFAWTTPPVREDCPSMAALFDQMASSLQCGLMLLIDYGYRAQEYAKRFPQGSLMAYRHHQATPDVLAQPGEQDITAHVDFTQLTQRAEAHGMRLIREARLSRMLMEAGEEALAKAAATSTATLKTLLFGLGESFDVLLLEKQPEAGAKSKRP